MEYLTGYTIKPHQVTTLGEVIFTDGTNNDLGANQVTCEAYGYTYDKTSGTCRSFRYNTNLERNIANINNKNNGSRNTTELGSNTIQVNGTNNTTKGFNNNCLINGNNNEIANGVSNAIVFGSNGEATADNSFVLGANPGVPETSTRQKITVLYGTRTSNNSVVDSYLNSITDSYFQIPEDTIVSFRAETVAVRYGGTGGGSVGDFKAWVERGVVVSKGSVLSMDSGRDVIANVGTTAGWVPAVSVSGSNFLQTVKGANNRDILWATTITFTQIKTGLDLT